MMDNRHLLADDLPSIVLRALPDSYSLVNLPSVSVIPEWATREIGEQLVSMTRSVYGLSIICPDGWLPADLGLAQRVLGWRVFRVEAPRDWAMHGLYSRLTQPLADDAISIYIVGSYNADHVLVRGQDFSRASQILSRFCEII